MKLIRVSNILGIILFLLLAFPASTRENSKNSCNKDWKYYRIAEKPVNTVTVLSATLPQTANIEPLMVNDQWQGDCWYRMKFQ